MRVENHTNGQNIRYHIFRLTRYYMYSTYTRVYTHKGRVFQYAIASAIGDNDPETQEGSLRIT